jgi:hypothetical protein
MALHLKPETATRRGKIRVAIWSAKEAQSMA